MASFAIICEGISENRVLHAIIDKYCDDAYFADVQPELNNNGGYPKQANWGGWQEVLAHCNTETFKEALAQNDYLVVQVDTDRCNEKGFDIKDPDKRDPREVYNDIVARLLRDIDPQLIEDNKDRIIFAICFNEIECWFLPIFYTDDKKCATNNCIYHLNRGLQKKDDSLGIPDKEKNNDQARKSYQYIFKGLKRKNISTIAQYNFGFAEFVGKLDGINSFDE